MGLCTLSTMLGSLNQLLSLFLRHLKAHPLLRVQQVPLTKDMVLRGLKSQLTKETGELRKMTVVCG